MGLNWIDNYFRYSWPLSSAYGLLAHMLCLFSSTGQAPVESFPLRLSSEAAGTILALPSDPAVLQDPDFISRGFTVGGKVSLVSQDIFEVLFPRRPNLPVNAQMWAGAYAEYVSPSWKAVFSVPEDVSTKTAAAIHAQGSHYASYTRIIELKTSFSLLQVSPLLPSLKNPTT